jgi:nitric oxide reductase large subunit
MNAIVEAGYLYELAGLVFYVFFLYMVRRRTRLRYTQRSRVLTIAAAIGLVGAAPFGYAHNGSAVAFVLLLGLAALGSALIDARTKP